MKAPFIVWEPGTPFPNVSDLQLPDRITNIMLHRSDDDFKFLHESAIVHHRGRFFVAWNNSPEGESAKGTVVRWISTDDDFSSWSEPALLAPSLSNGTQIWESCQLLSADERIGNCFSPARHEFFSLNAGR